MAILGDVPACDAALRKLLQATIRHEADIAARDAAIARIDREYSAGIGKLAGQIADLEATIELFYRDHRQDLEADGRKSIQLAHGLIGLAAPAKPALIPLAEKWTWEKIEAKVRRAWGKTRFFHAPKPPALDKNAIKKALDADQLRKCGLKLDDSENFYIQLNRLAISDPGAAEAQS